MSQRQIVLDTETTGLDPASGHRVIEIGCVELVSRRLTGKRFHTYLNPDRAIDAGAERVHGISTQFLQDKPRFADVARSFLDFIADDELIIHNAQFDLGFLNHELQLLSKGHRAIQDTCSVLDTLLLARSRHPGQKNNLDALCKRYFVDNSNRQLHGALKDAEILALVYLAMTTGQEALFDDLEPAANTVVMTTEKISKQKTREIIETQVIVLSTNEEQEHQSYLEFLRKKSGRELADW